MAKFNIKVAYKVDQGKLKKLLAKGEVDLSKAVRRPTIISTDSQAVKDNYVQKYRDNSNVSEIFVNGEVVYTSK